MVWFCRNPFQENEKTRKPQNNNRKKEMELKKEEIE